MPYTVAEFARKHRKAVGTVKAKIAQGKLDVIREYRDGQEGGRAARQLITNEEWPALGPGGAPSHRGGAKAAPATRARGRAVAAGVGIAVAIGAAVALAKLAGGSSGSSGGGSDGP